MADVNDNKGLIGTINSWWAHPFNSQGNALAWTLTVGFVIIVAFLWNLVLIEFAREV